MDDSSLKEGVEEVEASAPSETYSVRNSLPANISVETREKALELDRLLAVDRAREPQQLRISDPEAFAGYVGGATVWNFVEWLGQQEEECPVWGTKARDEFLDDLWRKEDKLSGCIYTMQSRIAVTGWTITGPVDKLKDLWRIFGEAEVTHDWTNYIRPVFQNYMCTDIGGITQVAYDEKGLPKLYYLPSRRCWAGPIRWGDDVWDLLFQDVDGKWKGFKGDQVYRFCSMPDTDPLMRQIGFSFMSRCQRSALRALKLDDYKDEKLSNLPAEGIATITGLTKSQVENARKLYEEERKRHQSLTFPGILWLVANTFGQEVNVDFISFRDVWSGFDEKTEAEIYMKTLALDAGVDVGELWQLDVTGATKAAGERQHRKALGKGPAEFMVGFERFGTRLLPEEYVFEFDVVDDEQDLMVQKVRAARIKNIKDLWTPDPVTMTGLVTTEQAQEMLAQERVVPRRFFSSEESVVTDIIRERSGRTIGSIDQDGFISVHRQFWAVKKKR